MSTFAPVTETPYDLTVQDLGGAAFVDVSGLIDILEKRAMMRLRMLAVSGVEAHIADFNRGQFAELQELYKALESYARK